MAKRNYLTKLLAVVCGLAIVLSAVFVPIQFAASAATLPFEKETSVVFSFEESENPVMVNDTAANSLNMIRGGDGIGCASWALKVFNASNGVTGVGWKHTNAVGWATSGGYRLNNNNGVFVLEPSSNYVVSFKLSVVSAPVLTNSITAVNDANLKLGYGFVAGTGSNSGNTVNSMNTVISNVFSVDRVPENKKNSAEYTVFNGNDVRTYTVGNQQHELTYVFSTPADLGAGSPALGFYAKTVYGVEFVVDDVTVTRLGTEQGAVKLVDEYYGTTTVITGNIGEQVQLPVLTSENAEHEFSGWYKDYARTETAEGITFHSDIQTVYSAWKAPVTVTFVDTLNGGEPYTVSGLAGEEIVYPTDPVDTLNNPAAQWFMGWYTTESYSEEYSAKEFGYTSYSVYSKWQGEIPEQIEDFENYTRDAYSVISATSSTGKEVKRKSNSYYFGSMLSKVDDSTNNGFGKVIKLDWDAEMVSDSENADSYNAAQRYANPQDRVLSLEHIDLIEDTIYTVTFDYFVENISDSQVVTVIPMTNNANNIWESGVNFASTQGASEIITASDKNGEWHKGEFTITAKFSSASRTAFFFILGLSENSDTVIYFDNVKTVAVQPYESTITYKQNNGDADNVVIGNRGEKIEEYVPYNNGLKFFGWYSDAELSIPFEGTEFTRNPIVVYAKWGGIVQNFRNYNKPNELSFAAYSLDVDKTQGAGYDDNYALVWNFDGDKVIDNKGALMYEKVGNTAHQASLVYDLKDKTTYEISFYVKVNSANSDANIKMLTTHGFNIYEAPIVEYSSAQCVISKDDVGKGWIKKSVILTTAFSKSNFDNIPDDLYFVFAPVLNSKETEIKLSIDNIVVNEVTQSAIIFNGNAVGVESAYQIGNSGDKINFPTLKNSDATFLGWYTDIVCDNPFNETALKEGVTEVYARWTALPLTFDTYQYYSTNTFVFGKCLKLSNENGNNLLNFTLVGDEQRGTDKKGNPTYFKDRITTSYDHIAKIAELHNNTAYKITYYYKSAEISNTDATIRFATANSSNIWETSARTEYSGSVQKVSANTKEWTKAETVIFTNFANETGKWLYVMFAGDNCKTTDTGRVVSVDFDNVTIEKIDKPYITYDGQNGEYNEFIKGTLGKEIAKPETLPAKFGYNFIGWFTDKECTVPFTQTVFDKAEALTVYAGYEKSSKVIVDFENYNIINNSGWFQFGRGVEVVTDGKSASGKGSVKVVREMEITNNYNTGYLVLGEKTVRYDLDPAKKYVVNFKYYIEKSPARDLKISLAGASQYNYFHNVVSLTDNYVVGIMEEKGVWKNGALIIDASKCKENANYLYLAINTGHDGIIYIDDIVIETLPEGHTGYIVDNGGCKGVPMYVTGKLGSSFANKLPKAPTMDNHIFIGYTYFDASGNQAELTPEKMVFSEEKMTVKATFVRIKTVQDFDSGYEALMGTYADYSNLDFDWEHYDSQKEGNSADNVASGRYSLHRKGTTMHFENAQILTQDLSLTVGERYTVTMKVKLGKHFQTDGAVKFASCKSPYYPWATSGDYYPIVAIKDLTDGEWHTVSYTFNAVELNLSVQTPGYCEIFIDDVVFERVDKDTPLSKPVQFTEYVPALRDANGNLIDVPAVVIDVNSILDDSLYVKTINILPYLIIGGALLIIVAGITVLLIVKKRKAKKV